MHDLASFATQVAQMRTAQKNYFRTKNQIYLKESKALEVDVDRALREIAPTNVGVAAAVAEQKRLFE